MPYIYHGSKGVVYVLFVSKWKSERKPVRYLTCYMRYGKAVRFHRSDLPVRDLSSEAERDLRQFAIERNLKYTDKIEEVKQVDVVKNKKEIQQQIRHERISALREAGILLCESCGDYVEVYRNEIRTIW